MEKEEEIKNKTLEDAEALLQMYQAGFLDGYNSNHYKRKKYRSLVKKIKKAFEFRFINPLQKQIKIIKKEKVDYETLHTEL